MAQQNKYRDIDKNVYDLYNIKEKYIKPVGFISIIVTSRLSDYYNFSNYDFTFNLFGNPDWKEYINNHLITFVEISSANSTFSEGFSGSSNYWDIECTISGAGSDFYIFPISGSVTNSNVTNTSYWLFPEPKGGGISFTSIGYRSKGSTTATNTDIDNSVSIFVVARSSWL